ncbi:MAG: DHHA1 domain-containing protein [Persephonella sp.]|nr:DHHA1 domain-containing protein [Persephonella sp.]
MAARSKDREIDVGKIMSYLGGGGHPFAASATVKGMTVQEIKNYIEALLLGEAYRNARKLKNSCLRDSSHR